MTTLAPARPVPIAPESSHRESTDEFVRWAISQLEASGVSDLPTDLTVESHSGLMERLRAIGLAVHARPVGQPIAVGDISPRLFDAYTIDGGQIQLAGCQLEDVPFVRLTFAVDEGLVRHVFVSREGDVVPADLVHQLGLLHVAPASLNLPRVEVGEIEQLVDGARHAVTTDSEPLAVAIVWTKRAAGKLQFTVGESTVELAFADWASLLRAPHCVGPHSGKSGFHLAATDDGRIDLASEIAACEQSGRRSLAQELATCCVTGKRVLPEFTAKCPVTGRPALVDQFATCSVCRERVSKAALDAQTCSACREMAKASKGDPRMARIIDEHPGLSRWSRRRLSETESVYIVQANGALKKLLLVVDKQSLTVRQLAVASRFSREWRTVSSAEKQTLLA